MHVDVLCTTVEGVPISEEWGFVWEMRGGGRERGRVGRRGGGGREGEMEI